MRRVALGLTTAMLATGLAFWWSGSRSETTSASEVPVREKQAEEATPFLAEQPSAAQPAAHGRMLHDPVLVSPCHVTPIQEQEVSSAIDGILKEVRADLGERVHPGDLLGKLDDRQLRAQVELLQIKAASKAAELIAKAQHDDFDAKITMAGKLRQRDAISELEYKTYFFQRERFAQEMKKAREDQATAQKELEKSQTILDFHDLRSSLEGEVIKVYKRNGEGVKQSEPLFRVANFDRLRLEGLCKLQQAELIRVGMRALVEPEQRGEQLTELAGHTGTITGLALSADGTLLASGGEDRTVIIWQWPSGTRRGLLVHGAEVHSVTLSGLVKTGDKRGWWLLTGAADGQARLWFVPEQGAAPTAPASIFGHEGPVRTVAFSADGARCASGSDDRRIGIWDTHTGKHLFWLRAGDDLPAHNGVVTSLRFTPDGYLVSAGRDNTLKIWKLTAESGQLVGMQPGRTGDATQLGVSPDGQKLLFDHGEELRILDRGTLAAVGLLRSTRQERFRGLAQFSPSGQLILAAAGNGRVQLWKVPATPEQAAAVRQAHSRGIHADSIFSLLPGGAGLFATTLSWSPASSDLWNLDAFEIRSYVHPSPTTVHCAVFAVDESVVFTGGSDKVIHVWSVPEARQWQHRLEARIMYIGSQVEPGTDMVRIRAEMDNPAERLWRLRPGTHATLRLYPETAGSP